MRGNVRSNSCKINLQCILSSRHQQCVINRPNMMKGIFCVTLVDCVYIRRTNPPLFGQKNRETQELCKFLCSQRALFRHLQKRKMRNKTENKSMPLNQLRSKSVSVQRWCGLHCPELRLSFPPHCEIVAGPPSRHYQTHAAYKKDTMGEVKSVCERRRGAKENRVVNSN